MISANTLGIDVDPDMRARLAAEIDAACRRAEGVPMRWGTDDCAMWCADIYARVLRTDPAAWFRGRYVSEMGATRILGRPGLANAVIAAAHFMKWRRIEPSLARTGDLGLVPTEHGPACAIRKGAMWICRGEYGFVAYPQASAELAWSVA